MNEKKFELLDKIIYPSDLRKLSVEQLPEVCKELRENIIEEVSVNPGHFASSLGVVELTVALHYVYNTPDDRIVWDVGHQAYGHKILTESLEAYVLSPHLTKANTIPLPADMLRIVFRQRLVWLLQPAKAKTPTVMWLQ